MNRNVVYHQGAAVVVVPQPQLYGETGSVNPHARCACNVCILGAIFIAVGIFAVFLIKVQSKMSYFLGTRRESVYIMSLTGIILGIFLMVGSLLLLYDIEKRQQRRVNHRMRRAMLMNDDLSAFERPDVSSDDEDEVTATSGMNKRCQVLPPSCTASPAGRIATYSTDPALGVPVEIHPKYPSRQISPYQSGSGSTLGAYSISGEIPSYRSFSGGGMARDYIHPLAPSEGQIISCQTFPTAGSDSHGNPPHGHEGGGGGRGRAEDSEAPPAYESQPGIPGNEGASGGPAGFLPHYQHPPPYTPYTDDPPPYSP